MTDMEVKALELFGKGYQYLLENVKAEGIPFEATIRCIMNELLFLWDDPETFVRSMGVDV